MTTTIARIIEVIDTREYVEDGDRFIPVPGSGQAHNCDRCGTPHEVHAHVELSDGSRQIVGTSCMGRDWTRSVRSAAGRAQRQAAAQAEIDAWRARLTTAIAIEAEVDALTPPVPELDHVLAHDRGVRQVWRMGIATVWTLPGGSLDSERRWALLQSWRWDQCEARGLTLTRTAFSCRQMIAELERRLEAKQRRAA